MGIIQKVANPGPATPAASIGLLLLRLGMGGQLAKHGWDKLAHFTDMAANFPDPLHAGHSVSLGLAIGSELVCAALVALGFLTRAFAVPVVFLFCVILFVLKQPYDKGGEMAALYLTGFLALLFVGAGKFSVDGRLGK
jgi:putative oxidoreductase